MSTMGRESNEQMMIQSSILLLQERFRQLQRLKEMRAERELLRATLLNPNPNPNPFHDHQALCYHVNNHNNEPTTRFGFFQFLPLDSPASQLSLSLEHPSAADLLPLNGPNSKFGSLDHGFDPADDVDTSLHL